MPKPVARPAGELSALRVMGALVFERLCAMTGMTGSELCQHLDQTLARSHQMQLATLRTWRNGTAAVPLEALLSIADLVHFRFPGFELLLLGETIDNESRRRDAYRRILSRSTSLKGKSRVR
jgi:hypothetical protein